MRQQPNKILIYTLGIIGESPGNPLVHEHKILRYSMLSNREVSSGDPFSETDRDRYGEPGFWHGESVDSFLRPGQQPKHYPYDAAKDPQ